MNYTFDEIKEKIFRSFVENGEKKMEGMIYYDYSLKSFLMFSRKSAGKISFFIKSLLKIFFVS